MAARRKHAHRKCNVRKRRRSNLIFGLLIIGILLFLVLPDGNTHSKQPNTNQQSPLTRLQPAINGSQRSSTSDQTGSLANWTYQGRQIVAVNHNQPTFTSADLTLARGSWQTYGPLDRFNRVTAANAMLGTDLMPREPRERLYIQPTAYHNKRIWIGNHQDWLYNRCHLIGYQLTGQNNNPKNLMTGTRSLNDPAMTYYENQIANYLKQTRHHVRYQVEPIFKDQELLARGVHMQGQSVEDQEVKFNIYIFNVQAGVTLNYQDGTSIIRRN